jgi:hypothetical protein
VQKTNPNQRRETRSCPSQAPTLTKRNGTKAKSTMRMVLRPSVTRRSKPSNSTRGTSILGSRNLPSFRPRRRAEL